MKQELTFRRMDCFHSGEWMRTHITTRFLSLCDTLEVILCFFSIGRLFL